MLRIMLLLCCLLFTFTGCIGVDRRKILAICPSNSIVRDHALNRVMTNSNSTTTNHFKQSNTKKTLTISTLDSCSSTNLACLHQNNYLIISKKYKFLRSLPQMLREYIYLIYPYGLSRNINLKINWLYFDIATKKYHAQVDIQLDDMDFIRRDFTHFDVVELLREIVNIVVSL